MNIVEDYDIRENKGKCLICRNIIDVIVIDLKIVGYECPQCGYYVSLSNEIKI